MRAGQGRFDAFIPFFPVHDLAATRDFYERELGLEVEQEQARCLILSAGGGHLGFCLSEAPPPAHDGLVLSLLTGDVDGLYQRLRVLGIEIEQPPRRDEHYSIYHFFVHDPDGYRVEFRSFLEPGGEGPVGD